MKSKSPISAATQKELVRLVLEAYDRDPLSFDNLLPGVGSILQAVFEKKVLSAQAFGMTGKESLEQMRLLDELIDKSNQAQLTADEAKSALEKCAILIDSDCLPLRVDHESIRGLLAVALGYSPKSVDQKKDIPFSTEKPAREVFVIRGVKLILSWDYKLVSISISPADIRERNSLLSFIGIIRT
jgi:hypothetical protein